MKMKNLLFLMMAVFALSFAACSDDDDDSLAGSVAGQYSGELEVNFPAGGIDTTYTNQKINITSTSEDRVTLKLENFKFGGINIGTIVIEDVLVKQETDTDDDDQPVTYKALTGNTTIEAPIFGDTEIPLDIEVDGEEYKGYVDIGLEVSFGESPNINYVYVNFYGKR